MFYLKLLNLETQLILFNFSWEFEPTKGKRNPKWIKLFIKNCNFEPIK